MSDITENSIYKNAKDREPSNIMISKKPTHNIEDIAAILESFVKDQPEEIKAAYRLGKLYRDSIKPNSSSNDVILILLISYKEILQRELSYNNNIEKNKIVKNCIEGLESFIKILEDSEINIDSNQFLFLLRSIIL